MILEPEMEAASPCQGRPPIRLADRVAGVVSRSRSLSRSGHFANLIQRRSRAMNTRIKLRRPRRVRHVFRVRHAYRRRKPL